MKGKKVYKKVVFDRRMRMNMGGALEVVWKALRKIIFAVPEIKTDLNFAILLLQYVRLTMGRARVERVDPSCVNRTVW